MLLFFDVANRGSLVAAAVATATAILLCLSVGRRQGIIAGVFVGLVYLASPLTQSETDTLMLDGPVTLACLSAFCPTPSSWIPAGFANQRCSA